MKRILSYFSLWFLLVQNIAFADLQINNNTLTPISAPIEVDILKDGITQNNAGIIMSQKTYTGGILNLDNLKFTVINGVKVALDNNIKNSFETTNITRSNFSNSKTKTSFKAKATYEDKIIEYPDRVRIITKTKFEYNNKTEYEAIFTGTTNQEITSSKDVTDFISKNQDYSEYGNGIEKLNKKELTLFLVDKLYNECTKKGTLLLNCNKNQIKNQVENLVNSYKGTRTVTETIDVNKIPLIYDADKTIDFTQRLIDSNISKEPQEVRLSSLQIKNSFAQYTSLNSQNNIPLIQSINQTIKNKTCEGLTGKQLTQCNAELEKLSANNSGENTPLVYSGTLLNGFTLGDSYSYKLGDSYSIAGFTVYNIGVSFYAGYGVGIRVPIDYTAEISKDRLEKGVSQDYKISLSVDTEDKDTNWFKNALGESKAFDGKEAVLEAGAYAKGKIILLEKTVFNEQIGGKKDWGNNLKMPFGTGIKKKIFDGEVQGNEIGLEVILYGLHISGDLMAEGYITGDISYECRNLSSQSTTGDSTSCRDIMNTKLKDQDVPDILIDPETKSSTLDLKGESDKFYYKNDLGVYQKYGVSLSNFKYKPDLNIDLFLRGKIGVDTGDYFGRFWLKTPRLKVYTFEMDLPTLRAHDGYSTKKIDIYENNYLYNFSKDTQDTNENMDSSVSCLNYTSGNETNYFINDYSQRVPDSTGNTFYYTDYLKYYNYSYGGNLFYKNNGELVYQDMIRFGDSATPWANYYQILSTGEGNIRHKYGSSRSFDDNVLNVNSALKLDYDNNKVSEMQYVNNDKVYYYSQSENALYTGDIATPKVQYNPVPKLSQINKYKQLNSTKKPKKNQFYDIFGSQDDYDNITDYFGAYKFKKFNFAFSDDFSQNKMFAYIAEDKSTKKPSVQIYKNGSFYKEISETDLEYNSINPVYIQLIGNDLLIISEDINNSNGEKTYTLYEYNYQDSINPFVLEYSSERKKTIFNQNEIVTSYVYNKSNKTLFVSYLAKNGAEITSKIASIRFNGNENIPYKKDIYTTSLTKEELIDRFNTTYNKSLNTSIEKISDNQEAQTYITNIQLGKDSNSLLISLDYSFLYELITSNAYYILSEAKVIDFTTSEGQKDEDGNCITATPQITSFNIGPNITNSGSTNSDDEYVNEKLKEINDCFINGYNQQLDNINSSIDKLINEKNKQTDQETIEKYSKAISKLEKIKSLFITRYETIINLDK